MFRVSEFDKDILDEQQWVEDFTAEQKETEGVRDSANQLLAMVDDPKFANSEVIMSTPLGGGHIIFAFAGVRRPTWFPDI